MGKVRFHEIMGHEQDQTIDPGEAKHPTRECHAIVPNCKWPERLLNRRGASSSLIVSFSRTSVRLVTPKFLHSSRSSPVRRTSSAMVLIPKPNHALAGPHRQVQIGNRPIQQRRLVGAQNFRLVDRLGHRPIPWRTCPSASPLASIISRISTSDVSPKFLLASNSASVVFAKSPNVITPIFCRQLRLRTESSKSVTGTFSTWLKPIARAAFHPRRRTCRARRSRLSDTTGRADGSETHPKCADNNSSARSY